MKRLIIAALLIASPAAAQDNEWTYAATNSSGSDYYIRTQDWLAGRSHHRAARAWVMTNDSRNRNVEWMSSKALYEVDCVGESYRRLSTVVYYRNGRASDLGSTGREYIVPGSVFAALARELCSDPAPPRVPISRT